MIQALRHNSSMPTKMPMNASPICPRSNHILFTYTINGPVQMTFKHCYCICLINLINQIISMLALVAE